MNINPIQVSMYLGAFGVGLALLCLPFALLQLRKEAINRNKNKKALFALGFRPCPAQTHHLIQLSGFIMRNKQGVSKEQIKINKPKSIHIDGQDIYQFQLSQRFPLGNYTNVHYCFIFPLQRISNNPCIVILNPGPHSRIVAKATSEHLFNYTCFTTNTMKKLRLPVGVPKRRVLAMLSNKDVDINELINDGMLKHVYAGAEIGIGAFLANENQAMIAYEDKDSDEVFLWIRKIISMKFCTRF